MVSSGTRCRDLSSRTRTYIAWANSHEAPRTRESAAPGPIRAEESEPAFRIELHLDQGPQSAGHQILIPLIVDGCLAEIRFEMFQATTDASTRQVADRLCPRGSVEGAKPVLSD